MNNSQPALYFTHANGIPVGTYQQFLQYFAQDFNLKAIPMIGLDPQYPITIGWEHLVQQVIDDIEQQFPQQKVIGLGHSFGALISLMCAYKRPDLFSQLILMDPPFLLGKSLFLVELAQKFNLKQIHQLTPSGITLKRRDHWSSKEEAYQKLRHNRIFRYFKEQCFLDFLNCGLQDDPKGGLCLTIPKHVEAEIFKTVPAWWWRTPRKKPPLPVHLITANQSPFYKSHYPQNIKKYYHINYSLISGGHMFPLEQPEQTAQYVKKMIQMQMEHATELY